MRRTIGDWPLRKGAGLLVYTALQVSTVCDTEVTEVTFLRNVVFVMCLLMMGFQFPVWELVSCWWECVSCHFCVISAHYLRCFCNC